jgi:hypothetical protein
MTKAIVGVALALSLAFFSPGVSLAGGGRRVGVDVTGSPAGPIRSAVADVLKHHGFEVTSVDLSGDSEDAIASAAKKGKLAAVVVGEVRDAGKRAKLRVYGAGGDLIGEGSWTEHGGPKKLAADVAAREPPVAPAWRAALVGLVAAALVGGLVAATDFTANRASLSAQEAAGPAPSAAISPTGGAATD